MVKQKQLAVSALFSLTIVSVLMILNLGNFILDDSYIGFKSAKNLALDGRLYSYSNLDTPTNVWTSSLLYFISTCVLFFLQAINLANVSAYTFCILNINLLAVIFSVFNANIIMRHMSNIAQEKYGTPQSKSYSKLLMIFMFSSGSSAIIWLNGLETSITLAVLLMAIRSLVEKKATWLRTSIYLLVLTRPEIGIATLITVLVLKKRAILQKNQLVIKSVIIFVLPMILSKIITESFFPSSIVRVPVGNNDLIFSKVILFVKQLVHLPEYFILYFIPAEGIKYLSDSFTLTLISFVALTWCIIVFNKVRRIHVLNTSVTKIISNFRRILADDASAFVFIFLLILTFSLSAAGAGLGEQGRYFIYQFFLIVFLLIRFSFFTSKLLLMLSILNFCLLPFLIIEVMAINHFTNNVLKPLTKMVGEIGQVSDTLAIDSAGLLSTSFKGNVIDVYGLGTSRYAKVHGDFNKVYEILNIDKPKYVIAWETSKPTYYLDSAHYQNALENVESKTIVKYSSTFLGMQLHPTMVLYQLEYK